jgi:ribulose-phosphate 3-epimerase
MNMKHDMTGNHVKLAPSILAADFGRLGEHVAEAERCGADRIHVDVMDGHFVPNISMGPPIVESLRRVTRLPLETHLMITNPDNFLDAFAEAGSDSFLIHWEGNHNLHHTVQRVRQMIDQVNPACELEVDGGIDETTAPACVEAGARVLVAGTAIFGNSKGVAVAMERLRATFER